MFIHSSLLRSAVGSALISLSLFACSSDPVSTAEGDDALVDTTTESELRSDGFGGAWTGGTLKAGDFQTINLKANGTYEASVAVCPTAPAGGVSCSAAPRSETGRYSLLQAKGGTQTLRLAPNGGSVRRYGIKFAPTTAVVGAPRAIELTRNGSSQVLNQKPAAYNPCAGKPTGASCTICDPSDPSCIEIAVVKACTSAGACEPKSTAAYNPCAGKKSGDSCKICDPSDRNCFETAVPKVCTGAAGALVCR